MKRPSSYQRAEAIADGLIDGAHRHLTETSLHMLSDEREAEVRKLLRFYLYAAAHRGIVREMAAQAKARRGAR